MCMYVRKVNMLTYIVLRLFAQGNHHFPLNVFTRINYLLATTTAALATPILLMQFLCFATR